MTKLNPTQEAALAAITSQRTAYQNEKTQFEARMRAQFEVAMREKEAALHDSMYAAYTQGVPKTRIGLAYGTKDPGTVLRIIREQEALRALLPDEPTVTEPFTVTYDPVSEIYTAHINSYSDWTKDADKGYEVEDVTILFYTDEGFPVFTDPEDPWGKSQDRKIGVVARQIQMYHNSDNPLNKSIRAAKS